jgi:hypothetical protein
MSEVAMKWASALMMLAWVAGTAEMLRAGAGRSQAARAASPRAPTFEVVANWPTLPAGKVLGEVSSVTVDARDHVWVLHRPRSVPAEQRATAAPPVLEFDAAGRLVSSWGGAAQTFQWPEREHGIYADPKGFIWIGGNNGYGTPPPPGSSDDMLLKFSRDGKFLLQIGQRGRSQGDADEENVRQAADAALDAERNELFVADGYGNHRVIVFDAAAGTFKRMWGAFGKVPAPPPATVAPGDPPQTGLYAQQFGLVHAIKVSRDGLVYVADRSNRRVNVFTTDGTYRTQVAIGDTTSAAQTAAGLALSPDREQRFLYVADLGNAQILVLDRKTLRTLGSFGQRGAKAGEFDVLHHIAVDSKGNIYTAEIGRNRRVQKFSVKGLTE